MQKATNTRQKRSPWFKFFVCYDCVVFSENSVSVIVCAMFLLYLKFKIVVVKVGGVRRRSDGALGTIVRFARIERINDDLFGAFDFCPTERTTLTFRILIFSKNTNNIYQKTS